MCVKQKKEDDIMAEYLLKGGKMLEKTCKQCGCPQFEFKGKTFCVVCAEREQEKKAGVPPAAGKKSSGEQAGTAAPSTQALAGMAAGELLTDKDICAGLSAIILDLCGRIREEEDPDRCLALMDAVKIGAEALQILRQL